MLQGKGYRSDGNIFLEVFCTRPLLLLHILFITEKAEDFNLRLF